MDNTLGDIGITPSGGLAMDIGGGLAIPTNGDLTDDAGVMAIKLNDESTTTVAKSERLNKRLPSMRSNDNRIGNRTS